RGHPAPGDPRPEAGDPGARVRQERVDPAGGRVGAGRRDARGEETRGGPGAEQVGPRGTRRRSDQTGRDGGSPRRGPLAGTAGRPERVEPRRRREVRRDERPDRLQPEVQERLGPERARLREDRWRPRGPRITDATDLLRREGRGGKR